MPDITWTHPSLGMILGAIPVDATSIVDVGCGRGIIGALCRIYREPTRLVGVDGYQPSLDFCERHKLYDQSVLWDLQKVPMPFHGKEFQVAVCVEVIEHLPRSEAAALLGELARIAKRVIVTTPTVFHEQPLYDGNPHQAHLSRWTVRDFRESGFHVYGCGDMLIFGRTVRYLSVVGGPLTKRIPALSSLLLAVKDSP